MIHLPSFLRRFQAWRGRPAPAKPSRLKVWTITILAISAVLGFFFWFTSARILNDRFEIETGVGEKAFAESLGPLLGAEFSSGNAVQLLVNGDRFFPAMLDAIRGAQRTITLETYIWESGSVSDRFIEALSERARAGVRVHVLGDGNGLKNLTGEDQQRLLDAGVEFLFYGREKWYRIKPNINHRTHRKILIIDGRVGFTGGMCIADKWDGDAVSPEFWRETQVRVEGPVVRQMQAVFATNWLQTTSRLLFGPDYFPDLSGGAAGVQAQCYQSGPNESPEHARISYLVAIAAARESIQIANAYFVPDDLSVEMLVAARARGVRIEVIVPGVNDSRLGRAAARSRWGKLLAAGVEFHLYERAMLHAKVMTVDDTFTTIGSANFDNRSFGINDEINVNILDVATARRSREIFAKDIQHSRRLTLAEFESRPALLKLFDRFCGLFRSQI
ncbi:MAG: cardiolipin synthase B [Opitutaceae bacterium]|nr:cardiolipin synthase B [Opitutaceae bacterium]